MIGRTVALFVVTAVAEIVGCYLPFLVLRRGANAWLLVPGAVSLFIFAWLLSMHPETSAGRTYAAYGGVYVSVALLWMWWIESKRPDVWDVVGALIALVGMAIIAFYPRR